MIILWLKEKDVQYMYSLKYMYTMYINTSV